MAGYKSASFDPDAIASASDAASSALAGLAGTASAVSAVAAHSAAWDGAASKAAAASSAIATHHTQWDGALPKTMTEHDELLLPAVGITDQHYAGITEAGTAGAALALGEVCYFKATDSEWYLAKADVAATSGPVKVGLCVLAAGDGQTTRMLLWGKIRANSLFDTFTISAPLFISAATAGKIVSAAPTGTTNFVVRIVGYANSGDEVYFTPSNDYIELA